MCITCVTCGVPFGLRSEHVETLRLTNGPFCCPNGHGVEFKKSQIFVTGGSAGINAGGNVVVLRP